MHRISWIFGIGALPWVREANSTSIGGDSCNGRRMKTFVLISAFVLAAVTSSAVASANCRIHNDTGWDFKVESGSTYNQSVSAHSTTSIARPGRSTAR